MQNGRAFRIPVVHLADIAAIIAGGRCQPVAFAGRRPTDRAAIAIAGDEDRPLVSQGIDAGLRIGDGQVERVPAARDPDCLLNILRRITRLESRLLPVIEGGCQHLITIGRVTIAQFLDVLGYAENFLDQNQPAPARALWGHVVDADLGAIAHRHLRHRAAKGHVRSPGGLRSTNPLPMNCIISVPSPSRASLRLSNKPSWGRECRATFSTTSVE